MEGSTNASTRSPGPATWIPNPATTLPEAGSPGLDVRRQRQINPLALLGAVVVFFGGVVYAAQEVAYDELAGATVPYTDNWVFDAQGLAYFLVGFGILLALAGLARGWPTVGGGLAVFGSILMMLGDFAYAALRGSVPTSQILWTGTLDALGFLFLAIGLAVGIMALAVLKPEGLPALPVKDE